MRIGVMFDTERPFDDVVSQVAGLAESGIEVAWSSQIFAYDALTTLAAVSREVPWIHFGTAVVPTYPRHPVMLAAQALTVQAASGGRLTLGIGLSHQMVIENVFGMSFDKPARHMREYLEILMPLLAGEQVSFAGETLRASTFGPLQIDAPGARRPGGRPRHGHAADRRTDGRRHHHLDDRTRHHRGAHRPRPSGPPPPTPGGPLPQIGVGLPVCVTDDASAARAKAAETFAVYGHLPSYRAMLDREGAAGPADVAMVGTADEVAAAGASPGRHRRHRLLRRPVRHRPTRSAPRSTRWPASPAADPGRVRPTGRRTGRVSRRSTLSGRGGCA